MIMGYPVTVPDSCFERYCKTLHFTKNDLEIIEEYKIAVEHIAVCSVTL